MVATMAARPRITLLVVGSLREAFWRDAAAEYVKRLGGLTSRFETIEVDEDDSEREGVRLLAKLPPRALVIACDGTGKLHSSEALSSRIEQACVDGDGHLVFLIGGSDGLSNTVRERADLLLSFGPMTFPHQLLRVMLLEQLYRALQISKGSAYHK
jgi:23S rRNA (pseudouridine1915-N3)-methyltransferase